MLRLISQRLLSSILTILIISLVIFMGVEALPGDYATAYFGRDWTEENLRAMRAELGLDRPAPERYVEWLWDALRGDFGTSLARKAPVSELIGIRLRNSLLLGLTSGLIGLPLALMLGVVAGLNRDRRSDLWISTFSIVFMTLPEFVTATFLVLLFAIIWPIFPAVTIVAASASIKSLLPNIVLPIITLTFVMVAHNLRMVRTNVIDVMTSDYVQMATLKGLPRLRVVLRHALPNALMPTINLMALYIAWLIGGVVIIEEVFNYPGIGKLMVEAVHNRDVPLIQGIALVISGVYVVLNLGADLLVVLLNPRLRTLRG
jgi:peptide/nickel transport system permease protein